MSLAPLPLPRFIFLIGGDAASRQALAIAIAERDRSLTFEDLVEPLRSATYELFYGGMELGMKLDGLMPFALSQRPATWSVWLSELLTTLESRCGDQILSRLAIDRINASSFTTVERYLFRDARGIQDVRLFASRFGIENILCLHFHSNRMLAPTNVRNIFFPTGDAAENMKILEREFLRPITVASMQDLGE